MRARSDSRAMVNPAGNSREKLAAALRGLILITVFVMARMQAEERGPLLDVVLSVGAGYVLITTFLPWARLDMRRVTLSMLAVDILLVTALIYAHNGIRSEYYLLYYLPILHASVRLNFRDAVGTCLLSAVSYLLVGMLERPDASVTTSVISRVLTFTVSAGLLGGFFVLLSREQRAYRSMTKHYQEAIEAKNEFLSRVSHEFRTPLTAIVGFSQLLYEHDKSLDPGRHQEYLTVIREQSQHLARMIEDMLDMSRIDDGRLVLQQEATNLPDVIESAMALLDKPSDRDRVEVTVEPAAPTAWADRNEVEQAISRILYNALEFSKPDGRVSLHVQAEGEAREEVRVIVQAPGIDVKDEEMAPFFGPSAVVLTERPSSGNSLGLAVARALIEMHSGRIWVDDAEGGPAINFTLPAAAHRSDRETPEVIMAVGVRHGERAESNGEGQGADSGRRPVGTQADARQPELLGG
jgi:signal transduction histidine kinase